MSKRLILCTTAALLAMTTVVEAAPKTCLTLTLKNVTLKADGDCNIAKRYPQDGWIYLKDTPIGLTQPTCFSSKGALEVKDSFGKIISVGRVKGYSGLTSQAGEDAAPGSASATPITLNLENGVLEDGRVRFFTARSIVTIPDLYDANSKKIFAKTTLKTADAGLTRGLDPQAETTTAVELLRITSPADVSGTLTLTGNPFKGNAKVTGQVCVPSPVTPP